MDVQPPEIAREPAPPSAAHSPRPGWRRRLAGFLLPALLGGAVTLALVLVLMVARWIDALPDLSPWHRAQLDAEFTADAGIDSLEHYLELEDRLFAQLERQVVDRVPTDPSQAINRYSRGSLADPARWPRDWNRTFELPVAEPKGTVLLLHGMSDSPYSLRALGERLQSAGFHVLGLRLPGHGTAPSGLIRIHWQDLSAATELGARHLISVAPDRPLHLIGYSNGGALALLHALRALEERELPAPHGLILISPSIGVGRIAAFAIWQARLGRWLGIEKLAWNALEPEFDPYKYGSFAINAGDQVYRLTRELERRLGAAAASGRLAELPPILAFQSVVDATVSTAAVEQLFARLPSAGDHELVLFDVNRRLEIEPLLNDDPRRRAQELLGRDDLPFTLTLVENVDRASLAVAARSRTASGELVIEELEDGWPSDVYSLSHVALPFPREDPLYGPTPSPGADTVQIGAAAPRGERGVLRIPAATLLRLRWNPFFPWLSERVLEFLDPTSGAPAAP